MHRSPHNCFALFFFVAVASSQAAAHAVEATVAWGVGFSDLVGSPALEFTPKPAAAAGVWIGWDALPHVQLETGVVYSARRLTRSNATVIIEQILPSLQVPLLARFSPTPFLSLGAGPYLGFYPSTARETTKTQIGNAETFIDREPDALGLESPEIGIAASMRIALPVFDPWSAVFDARYLAALTEWEVVPDSGLKFRELQLLVGVRFGF